MVNTPNLLDFEQYKHVYFDEDLQQRLDQCIIGTIRAKKSKNKNPPHAELVPSVFNLGPMELEKIFQISQGLLNDNSQTLLSMFTDLVLHCKTPAIIFELQQLFKDQIKPKLKGLRRYIKLFKDLEHCILKIEKYVVEYVEFWISRFQSLRDQELVDTLKGKPAQDGSHTSDYIA